MKLLEFVDTYNFKVSKKYRICIYTKDKNTGEAYFKYQGEFSKRKIPTELLVCDVVKWRFSERSKLATPDTFMVTIDER